MCSGNAREWVIRQVSHANGEPAFFLEAVKDNAVGIPAGLPPLPPVPEGYSRWEYRGKAYLNNHTGYLAYNPLGHPGWVSRAMAIGAPGHYIEAVK